MYDKEDSYKDSGKGKGKRRKGRDRNSYPNKSRTSESRDRSDDGKGRGKVDFYKSETNDWRWYAANEQLLRDTASFAYGYATGSPINLGVYGDEMNKYSIPGVAAIRYVPTVGWSVGPTSPVNVAARNLYTFIRHANSGAKNYDSPDLLLYLLAMDSAISFLEYMKRMYGSLSLSNIVNRYYPMGIVAAQGGDYNKLITEMADLRAYINMYAVKLGSMCIPAHMSYMAKHKWLNSGLYLDSPTDKAQTYVFVPEGFHVFTHDGDGAGMLSFRPLIPGHGNLSLSDFKSIGEQILNPILYGYGEEDFNLISGDILKAYGPSGIYRPEGISESYVVFPVYDEVVLSQINNATMFGFVQEEAAFQLEQYDFIQSPDKSYLAATPRRYFAAGRKPLNPAAMDRLLVTRDPAPTPAFTMEASRLTNIPQVTKNPSGYDTIEYVTCGSEIATRIIPYVFMLDGAGQLTIHREYELHSNVTLSVHSTDPSYTPERIVTEAMDIFNSYSILSNFDYHPMFTITGFDSAEKFEPIKPKHFFGDVNNYTIVGQSDLIEMSEVALLSQFGIETFGKKSL